MAKKDKRPPVPPSAPQRKQSPGRPAPGPAKRLPRCLQGINGEPANSHPSWRLSLLDLDHDGDWSWQVNDGVLRKIIALLQEMERLTWTEIQAQLTGGRRRGPKHKYIPLEGLCPAAYRRLQELELDDFERLFRFRLGNMERLWGVVHDGIFYPVWWDPGHMVCPGNDPD